MKRIAIFGTTAFLISIYTLCGGIDSATASTVAPMNLSTMADYAGQVILGQVAEVRSYWANHPRRIESAVTFQQVEYLKGALANSPLFVALKVPGGTVGAMRMRLAGAPTFRVGEKWLLFLLPAYKTFPVVGLSRGAIRIQRDATGIDRVFSALLQPVVGVDPGGFLQTTNTQAIDARSRLVGSQGATLAFPTGKAPSTEAMSLETFRSLIEPVLTMSLDHHLTGPAGRRLLVPYTPVPLRRSASPVRSQVPGPTSLHPPPSQRGAGPKEVPSPGRERKVVP